MRRVQLQSWALILCGIAAQAAIAQTTAPDATAGAAGDKTAAITPQAAVDDSPELLLYKDIPVVVAAGKRQQSQREAPASVSVITSDDIETFGYRSLAEALRNQRSFYAFNDGLNWFMGERGFQRPDEWNARTMVQVDGRPTRENIYGQSNFDQDFVVPMEAVKRIEVVRGPGSALYGGNAVFSVIGVVTKDGSDVNGAQLKLTGGTQGAGRVNMLFGTTLNDGWDILGDIAGYTSQGDSNIKYDSVNDAAHDDGHIRDADYEGVEAAFLKARKGDFTLEFDMAHRDKDNRTARYFASFFDPGSMQEDRTNFMVKYDHEIADGQSVHAMVYYGSYHYQQSWLVDATDTAPAFQYTTAAQNDWIGEEVHYDWQMTDRFHLLIGGDATQSLSAHQRDDDTVSGQLLNIDNSYNQWGIFAEGELKTADWLTLTAGIRLDDVQRFGTSISPRFAAVFTPTKQDTIKLLYGRAFRQPNLYELFYNPVGGGNDPNPNLVPEVCDTYEVVWERQLKDGWRTSVGPYLWTMSHSLGNFAEPNGFLQTRNEGAQSAYGFEAEIQKHWTNGGSFRAYGTVTRAQDDNGTLAQSPSWILGTAFAIPIINKKTLLAVDPQIVGPQKSDLGQYVNPTFITNIVLTSKDVVKNVDVQAGVYNLFGESARLPHTSSFDNFQPTINYPHTQFLVSLTYRF